MEEDLVRRAISMLEKFIALTRSSLSSSIG